ncbi:hypothetical protein M9H77_09840 [Catharanthus roseus]|uniref:Uncharacterized protein n=2 Tax=Catharanthus roseus TaxID=4058 RepID=A0ACC0C1R9_CATRO|nr:hypothetical protein M9H77_09837 [Catharanthus roseus]KAI5678890.1 hypothetical protein M9H77_09840 [Catharanthus roseus]
MEGRELKRRDFGDIELEPGSLMIDWLAEISGRALAIFDQKESNERKKKCSVSDHHHHHCQVKKRKKEINDDFVEEEEEKPRKMMKISEKKIQIFLPNNEVESCSPRQEEISIKEPSKRAPKVKRFQDCVVPLPSDEEEKDQNSIKKLKRVVKKKVDMDNGPNPPPDLPREFKQALEEFAQGRTITDLKLVIQKGTTATDMSTCHNRLSLPARHILNPFLTEQESKWLELYKGNKKLEFIEVDIIQPSLKICKAHLRRWAMRKDTGNISVSFVLNNTWNGIASRNSILERDILQLWSVRVEEKLCFLLVKLPIQTRTQ